MDVAKAMVLAGRPGETRGATPAQLVPIANQPVLAHNLEALHRAGVREVAVAVDRRDASRLRAAIGSGGEWGVDVSYVEQRGSLPLAEALRRASDFAAGEPCVLTRGDVLMRGSLRPYTERFAADALDALLLRLPGDVHLDDPDAVIRPIRRALAPVGGCFMSPSALSVAGELALGAGSGLADLPEQLEARGRRVGISQIDGCEPAHGDAAALLDANRYMLEGITGDHRSVALDADVQGRVVVHPTARLHRAVVRGPAIIGPGAVVADSYVGPYTSVGAGVVIEGSEVENSIFLEGAVVRWVGVRVEGSVIGRHARVERDFSLPRAMRLTLDDHATVAIS